MVIVTTRPWQTVRIATLTSLLSVIIFHAALSPDLSGALYFEGEMQDAHIGNTSVSIESVGQRIEEDHDGPSTRQVYFVTTRSRENNSAGEVGSILPSRSVRAGHLSVSVPTSHRMGRMERPAKVEDDSDPQHHFSILSMTPLSQNRLVDEIEKDLARSAHKEIVIFVHGTNNTFQNAVLRTAQLSHDCDFDGVPICFAWPSIGKLDINSYHTDQALAMASVAELQQLLELLEVRFPSARRQVIAHSLGCRMMMTLALAMNERATNEKPLIDQLVFAAPDIDQNVFDSVGLEATRSLCRRLTIYVTPRDAALQISTSQNGDRRRVGACLDKYSDEPRVRVVDVTSLLTARNALSLNHMYFVENPAVMGHLRSLLGDQTAISELELAIE